MKPKREGRFTVRFLVLEPNQKKEDIREVEFTIKMTTYEDDRKLILDDYNDNHMSIYYNQFKCLECNISPVRDKYPRNNVFSKPYEYCYRYFHQYKLNYHKQDDKEFNKPLRLKIDFFTFDYKEYCQQTFCNENEESKSDFYRYVKSLFFDINELKSTFSEDFEYTDITNDPLTYMKEKCIFLLNEYRDSKYETIIRAYYKTITTNKNYVELHDTIFPVRSDKDKQLKNSYFSRLLEKFKEIAVKNNIPYIQARKFREIATNEVREEIGKSMKEQLQALRAKNDDKPERQIQ